MSVIDSLRRPEHTGENRCLPCTAVNVAIVVVVGLAVSVLSPVAGLVVLVGGALSVYLRGYVVPGTPSFAPQLVGAVGLAGVFDHGDEGPASDRRSESLDANVDPDVMLSALLNAGVLVEEEDGLFLTDDAREEWESTMATLRKTTDEELAEAVANAVPFDATVDAEFDGISLDGPSMSVWISRPQAIADVATLYTVVERGVDPMVALAATEPMRMFAEVCPDCGGPVEETTTRNCCGGTAGLYDSPEHEVLGCADCGAVVYEFPDE
ncbi:MULTISPECIES: hypothetical protein [Haloferax]|uniref:Uncharacterized protein n=1 Tax=Haloferax massiliensis TaxID=1476858 RepID=A0A0D6JPF7_9EURY|nr:MULTISPECIES: hypothetical protein [Haloferax]MDS0241108.1 hypothetical protein [Haloferax sp. S2CR25]MDS0444229.1 hypothetical protein [Haloferax sp. S2CR25-2]CQR49493.1 hypothetical protein BN996_00954 [Haloferax massiliensis]